MLVLACDDLRQLLPLADITAAMSVEGLLGTDRVFAADLQALRPHPGQAVAAANMARLLAGSEIVASHATPDCPLVQDAYSLRCAPQVAGAARDTLAHAETVAARELASAIDNPVVTLDGRVESQRQLPRRTGRLRARLPGDRRRRLASMSERRTDRFLDAARSHGLPPFLADDPGVDSGHMIAQYTQAAIVSELKRLASPASVDSIPSSAMQEDHVSMGWSAARKLRRSIDGLTRVLAIEALTAARGLDLRAPLRPSPATAAVRDAIRVRVGGPGPDRFLAPEIGAAVELAASGALLRSAEMVVGDAGLRPRPVSSADRRPPGDDAMDQPRRGSCGPVVEVELRIELRDVEQCELAAARDDVAHPLDHLERHPECRGGADAGCDGRGQDVQVDGQVHQVGRPEELVDERLHGGQVRRAAIVVEEVPHAE